MHQTKYIQIKRRWWRQEQLVLFPDKLINLNTAVSVLIPDKNKRYKFIKNIKKHEENSD